MKGLRINISHVIKDCLPVTYAILESSQMTVHPAVYKVILTGSRGLAGHFRDDSDIDLSLIVDRDGLKVGEEETYRDILNTTLQSWKSTVELDTVIVFDINNCKLSCFECDFNSRACKGDGVDCLGLYKTQKGFNGYVPKIGISIQKIYPMITVWERAK